MATTRDRIAHKHFRPDTAKIRRAQRLLGAGTEARPVMYSVARRPRSLVLAPFVASFHYHEGNLPAALERILPTGQAHLMVNLSEDEFRTYSGMDCGTVSRTGGAVLAGPHGRSTVIDTREQRWLVAVEFKSGGAAPFFTVPISETRDQVVELEDLWDARVPCFANGWLRLARRKPSSGSSKLCSLSTLRNRGTRQLPSQSPSWRAA